jgi:hypothetical protein
MDVAAEAVLARWMTVLPTDSKIEQWIKFFKTYFRSELTYSVFGIVVLNFILYKSVYLRK